MNPISDLRAWAGVDDASQDSSLRLIEAASVRLLERATNRLFRCPPERLSVVLDGPEVETYGLSRIYGGPVQWVTLPEEPRQQLTGTVTVSAGGTAVVGSGTSFTSELSADPASSIVIAGEPILVSSITDDTNLVLAAAHVAGASGVTAKAPVISVETRYGATTGWLAENPADFELDGRRLLSPTSLYPPGQRTVRVQLMIGFLEGEGPADASLLVLEMVKAAFRRMSGDGEKSVSVHGGFTITWASLGEESAAFQARARLMSRGVMFS